jgi:hypothetical protein
LILKPKGKRPFGRPTRKWEDIKMDLAEVGQEGHRKTIQKMALKWERA